MKAEIALFLVLHNTHAQFVHTRKLLSEKILLPVLEGLPYSHRWNARGLRGRYTSKFVIISLRKKLDILYYRDTKLGRKLGK